MNIKIIDDVKFIMNIFSKNNYESFLVGGCVRDSLLNKIPTDFDIATSSLPEVTQSLFLKTVPTGIKHGTITVLINNNSFEVTTFRTEKNYINNRKPEKVEFVSNIKEDLSRRDFTINALAYNETNGLLDYFDGVKDLNNKIIRTVGDPDKRFNEDALRMLRAIRFATTLDFKIEENTFKSIQKNFNLIKNISPERIKDEFCKILTSNNPSLGLTLLQESKLLSVIIPEIDSLVKYTPLCNNHNNNVFLHTLNVISNTKNNDLKLRLCALFHDVGKLNTLDILPNGNYYFPKHSEVSAIMTREILSKLKFSKNIIDSVCDIIPYHLVHNPDIIPSDGEIKRAINKIGVNNIYILFELQRADVKSLWTPAPFLAKIDYIENKVKEIIKNKDPLTTKDLVINGLDIINDFNIEKNKLIGDILNYLLEKVLDDKNLNTYENLISIIKSDFNL